MSAPQDTVSQAVLEIVRLLVSEIPHERDRGADQISDVVNSLTPDHRAMLARLLVFARLNEPDESCQEAQLNALATLHSTAPLPADVLKPLRALRSPPGSQRDHLAELLGP
jgi:hypothetical protein